MFFLTTKDMKDTKIRVFIRQRRNVKCEMKNVKLWGSPAAGEKSVKKVKNNRGFLCFTWIFVENWVLFWKKV